MPFKALFISAFIVSGMFTTACASHDTAAIAQSSNALPPDSIAKITMSLSAFGVESDDAPNINVIIDFMHDSSRCERSYYNPAKKGAIYRLSENDLRKIRSLLTPETLHHLQKKYSVDKTDQPTSTLTIYTLKEKFEVTDYGLGGEAPLQELYKIVYK